MKLTQINNYTKIGIVALTSMFGLALPTFADVIDFDSEFPAGPSLYNSTPGPATAQTLTTDNTTFSGGVILTETANLPADQTSVYGTASSSLLGDGNLTDPLVIDNPDGFNNFFFDLYNGEVYTETFTVSDNAGHSATFVITSNTSSGVALVGFASTGTEVTISVDDPNWDFFIDNVTFDEPLPPSLVPEVSSTAWLLAGGLISLAAFAGRRRAMA